MKTVNPYFIDVFLIPIAGLGDDDEAVLHYQNVELINENQYKLLIRETLVEPFKNLGEVKKKKSKIALSYYLTKSEIDFLRIFESCLPPFDAPENARDFFVWIWEEIFVGESYLLSDVESFKIVTDIHEPNRF